MDNISIKTGDAGIGDNVSLLIAIFSYKEIANFTLYCKNYLWLKEHFYSKNVKVLPLSSAPVEAIEISFYSDREKHFADLYESLSEKTSLSMSDWFSRRISETLSFQLKESVFPTETITPGDIIVLSPFASNKSRTWSAFHWRRLVKQIKKQFDIQIYITCTPGDYEVATSIAGKNDAIVFCKDAISTLELMRKSFIHIGNDSGMSHVCGLYGINFITISAQLPSDLIYSKYMTKVASFEPDTICAGCCFLQKNDFEENCTRVCSSLQTINPSTVFNFISEYINEQRRNSGNIAPIS